MTIYEAGVFLSFSGLLILSIIPVIKDRKNVLYLWLSAFNFASAIWQLDLFLLRTADSVEAADIASRLLRPFVILLPYLMFNLSATITKSRQNGVVKILNYVLLSLSLLMILMNISGFGFAGCVLKEGLGYVPQKDLIYSIFIFAFLIGIGSSIIMLISGYMKKDITLVEKNKIGYFTFAFVVGIAAGSANLLNIFGVNVYLMGMFGLIAYFVIISFAILSYNLMDFRHLLQRSLTYIFIAAIVFGFYLFVYYVLEKYPVPDFSISAGILFILTLCIVLAFEPVFRLVNYGTKKLFMIKDPDYQEMYGVFSDELREADGLENIFNSANSFMMEHMNAKECVMIFKNSGSDLFELYTGNGDIEKIESEKIPLYEVLKSQKIFSVTKDLKDEIFYSLISKDEKEQLKTTYDLFRRFNAEVVLFFESKAGYEGVWLVGERSGGVFDREDRIFMANLLFQIKMKIEGELLIKKVEQSEKYALIGRMAEAVSREIREPLHDMSMIMKLLSEEKLNDAKMMKSFLEKFPSGYHRLDKLTSDLVLISSADKPVMESTNLRELLAETVEVLKHLYPDKNVRINYYVNNSIFIRCDKKQISQLLLNVVMNAFQAVRSDGNISFTATTESKNGKEYYNLTVIDDGEGIETGNMRNIFRPFFTTKKEGAGLGLTLSDKIINAHNGFFEVESESGKGTKFSIFFSE